MKNEIGEKRKIKLQLSLFQFLNYNIFLKRDKEMINHAILKTQCFLENRINPTKTNKGKIQENKFKFLDKKIMPLIHVRINGIINYFIIKFSLKSYSTL